MSVHPSGSCATLLLLGKYRTRDCGQFSSFTDSFCVTVFLLFARLHPAPVFPPFTCAHLFRDSDLRPRSRPLRPYRSLAQIHQSFGLFSSPPVRPTISFAEIMALCFFSVVLFLLSDRRARCYYLLYTARRRPSALSPPIRAVLVYGEQPGVPDRFSFSFFLLSPCDLSLAARVDKFPCLGLRSARRPFRRRKEPSFLISLPRLRGKRNSV